MSNATTPAIDATSNATSESILDDLLGQLGDDTVLESVGTDTAAKANGDEVIENDVVSPDAAVAAEAVAKLVVEADITDEVIDAIANAAAAGDEAANKQLLEEAEAAPATAPKKGRGGKKKDAAAPAAKEAEPAKADAAPEAAPAKKGRGKKQTSVPAGYGSDAEEGKQADAAPAAAKEPAAPKEPKAPRATSVTHSPGDLLMHKLGTGAKDMLVFDLTHTQEMMDEARDIFIARMNDRSDKGIANKVRDKICMLLVWLHRGAAGDLNEVLKRTFTVLHKEGKLTSGEKGNLQQNLLAKPYSIGTARSQANQMFMALPELNIVIKNKGEMLPNENSPLLAMINAKLGLK